jgi:hypothetical protein
MGVLRSTPRFLVGAVLFVFLFASPLTSTKARAEASRVRILLLSDRSGNAKERQRRAVTLNRLRSVLRRSLRKQGLGRRYTLDVLAGPRLTPDNVLNYYRNLRTGPNEALVFYGNAHGGTNPQRGLYISLSKRALFRSELRAAMLRKDPRLAVILTDTCAGLPGRPARNAKTGRPRRSRVSRRMGNGNGRAVRQLFFQHRGVVEINAARIGYSSWGNTKIGDYFTRALGNLIEGPARRIDRNQDGFVTWREFYPALDREARRVSAEHGVYQPATARLRARKDNSRRRATSVGRRSAVSRRR